MLNAYVPGPEREQKSEPGEEENSPIFVDWVQERYAASFLGDGVDFW